MCELVNIECVIIEGFARTSAVDIEKLYLPNHNWNAVKLNNKWYLCDATWSTGVSNMQSNLFTFQYNDGYFLTEPELFALNHYPVNKQLLLLNEANFTFQEFATSPLFYGNAYKYLAKPLAPKKMIQNIKKNDTLVFIYLLKEIIDIGKIQLVLNNGIENKTVKPTVLINDKELTIKHSFKSKGFFDVHFFIGTEIIATYTVNVEN